MARPGRKPQPTELKIRNGEYRTERLNLEEPETETAFLDPPLDLLDDIALEEWRRVARPLYNEGYTTRYSRACLLGYCNSFSQYVGAVADCAKFGAVITSVKTKQDGTQVVTPYVSPWAVIRSQAQKEMRAWMCELGMTPSSRSRVVSTKPKTGGIQARNRA